MDKKVIIDDALISTDIDQLIKYLSFKKKVEINMLARELNTKVDIVKKWIVILEEEGYVKVEYILFNEFIVWAGEELPAHTEVSESVKNFQGIDSDIIEKEEQRPETKIDEIIKSDSKIEIKSEIASKETPLELTIREQNEKKSINSIESEEFKAAEHVSRIIEKLSNTPEEKKHDDGVSSTTETKIDPSFSEEKNKKELEHEENEIISLKKLLSKNIEEINAQKTNIEKLKTEREKLLSEACIPLENKFKLEYGNILEKLLEKEHRIAEMTRHVIELPTKINELTKVETALKHITQQGRHASVSNREELEKLKHSLHEEDQHLLHEIENIELETKAKKSEIANMSKTLEEINNCEQKIKKEVEKLNKQLTEVNESIASTYNSINEVFENGSKLSRRLENVKIILDARAHAVSETYSKRNDIEKIETAISQYIEDYEKKIADIENYANESEKDLVKLKEFAEVKYIRNCINELDRISSNYEQELESMNIQEKSIEERIHEAKNRFNNLLQESRELVKSLEEKTLGKEFEKLIHEVKRKQEVIVSSMKAHNSNEATAKKIFESYSDVERAVVKKEIKKNKKIKSKKKKK